MDVGQMYEIINILILVMIVSAILLIILYGYLRAKSKSQGGTRSSLISYILEHTVTLGFQ